MRLTFLILFLISGYLVLALEKPLSGIVRDAKTQEPLPFTTIAVQGKFTGTISNAEGRYVLDAAGLSEDDIIVFSYVGYDNFKISVGELLELKEVFLKQATLNLSAVSVYSKELGAKDIIKLAVDKYPENHPKPDMKQRIFYHKYEKTPWPEENKLILKESDFVGLDRAMFDELFNLMPEEFVEYHDAMVDLYSHDGNQKLEPIEAISLEEGSMQQIQKEVEKKLSGFFEDIEKTQKDPDIYYKFRTGIFAGKVNNEDDEVDSVMIEQKKDSAHLILETDYLRSSIKRVMNNWGDLESENWEFINKTGRYDYTLGSLTIFNDVLVYPISFKPQRSGLFEGKMYISVSDFGILQLDFQFAEGKQSENIHLLGFGHSTNFKKGSVIFDRNENGYFLKYIYAHQNETGSIDRNFSVMKKKKRFLIDKELSEIKMSADLTFDMDLYLELLVLERQSIDEAQFDQIKEPKLTRFKKEFAYTPDVWNNRTVIAPSSELQKYKRGE